MQIPYLHVRDLMHQGDQKRIGIQIAVDADPVMGLPQRTAIIADLEKRARVIRT